MAAAPSIPDKGARGPRMSRAVVDLSGDILRDILYPHYTPAQANAEVLRLRGLQQYHPVKDLTPRQMSKLQVSSTNGNYRKCDVTLLFFLLSKLVAALRPTDGWEKAVKPGSLTLGDDAQRIKFIRNDAYGHIACSDIPFGEYIKFMKQLYSICVRMDTTHASSLRPPTQRTL